jgi:hypothetical protein
MATGMLSCRAVGKEHLLVFTFAVGAVAAGCATASSPQIRERARQHVLAGKSCPGKKIVFEDSETLAFVLSGCGRVVRIGLTCDSSECINQSVTGTTWARPRRLLTTDEKLWQAPGFVFPPHPPVTAPVPPGNPPADKGGRRVTSMDEAVLRPRLPPELNSPGVVVWGLFRVCVDAAGMVSGVEVLKSTLPGGMDGDWIAKIEGWRYSPYLVDGRASPFCLPVRVQVNASG